MADPVFALSPIAARGAMPSEEDYDAIREAFMETSRGRWFLAEYAKRNRNADTSLVLDAVARLEQGLAAQKEQARHDETGDTIVAVAALLSQMRSEAEALLAVTEAPTEDSAALKGVRVLREMSWKLRESGNDARIPNMLERQATAIEEGLKAAIGEDTRGKVLALFDRLAGEVEALGREGASLRQEPVPVHDAAATPAPGVDEYPVEQPRQEIRVEDTAAFNEALLDIPDETEVAVGDAEVTNVEAANAEVANSEITRDAPVTETAEAQTSVVAHIAAAELAPTPALEPAPKPSAILPDAIVSPAAIKPHQETQSLGASLIEKGLVSRPDIPRGDPLAPFKRMTQAERVAFFS